MDKQLLDGNQCRRIEKNPSQFSAMSYIARSEEECEEGSLEKKKGLKILTLSCTKLAAMTLVSS